MVAADLNALLVEVQTEFPGYSLVPKANSTFMKVLNVLLMVITCGQNKTFMSDFITTIGNTTYTNILWSSWSPIDQCAVIRHERVHLRQQKRYGRFLFSLIYLVPIFPVGVALGRTKLEQEAYTETVTAYLDYCGTNYVWSSAFQTRIASYFTGPSYGWMWCFPKSIAAWITKTVDTAVDKYAGKS